MVTQPKASQWQTARFIALLFAALGLIPGGAHVLELPPKMQYAPELYATVNRTLYKFYGLVGAFIQIGALLAAIVLSYMVRGHRSFRPALFGMLGLLFSLVLWFSFVAPVNAEWARVIAAAPSDVPAAYERLRPQWEYGHAAAFVAWLTGFCLLLRSTVGETPKHS